MFGLQPPDRVPTGSLDRRLPQPRNRTLRRSVSTNVRSGIRGANTPSVSRPWAQLVRCGRGVTGRVVQRWTRASNAWRWACVALVHM